MDPDALDDFIFDVSDSQDSGPVSNEPTVDNSCSQEPDIVAPLTPPMSPCSQDDSEVSGPSYLKPDVNPSTLCSLWHRLKCEPIDMFTEPKPEFIYDEKRRTRVHSKLVVPLRNKVRYWYLNWYVRWLSVVIDSLNYLLSKRGPIYSVTSHGEIYLFVRLSYLIMEQWQTWNSDSSEWYNNSV